MPITVPAELAASIVRHHGRSGREFVAALPGLAAEFLRRWELEPDGNPWHGVGSLVLPVNRADGAAVLKLRFVEPDTEAEPVGLRAWNGAGAVELLDHDPATGTMLLERLDGDRTLGGVPDDVAALHILSELLSRLVAVPAPAGVRRLSDLAGVMLHRAAEIEPQLPAEQQRWLAWCAAQVREVVHEPGDRLLHWDLHYDNVLAAHPADRREPWLAIDPQPLAGDPCFELLPALHNRWDDVVATGDPARAVRRRFDLMTEVLELDRARARAWTCGRLLQEMVWHFDDGEPALSPAEQVIVTTLTRER
ncbi:aminoglycoside phosphotransferase family protein [Saccharopolyspora sp. SCSIO 74807]|uniref:aminoglycoside phosphotransferase family protein n=1 Tax=Saccharopolyspora sp. SCSIO 74807 TaxID=3118084 RepID=UPI0030D3B83B